MIAHRLCAALTPFPRKSLRQLFNRERTPPPKLPLTTISEPDPIYPSCFGSLLATTVPASTGCRLALTLVSFFLKKTAALHRLAHARRPQADRHSYIFNTSRIVARTKIARGNARP